MGQYSTNHVLPVNDPIRLWILHEHRPFEGIGKETIEVKLEIIKNKEKPSLSQTFTDCGFYP